MSVVLDTNMKLFADRIGITSSRMINDYGQKSVDEIIEAEAAKGNSKAVNYAQEVYNSPPKLIKLFRLTDVENRYVILHNMDNHTRQQVLPLLDENDLVMGLYFFTQEGLLRMLLHVDIEELVRVVLNVFPLENIIEMLKEEDLAMLFQNQEMDENHIMEELKKLPPEVMKNFIEGVTGKPSEQTNQEEFLKSIENLPEDKFRDFMSVIDPDVQRQLTFQLTKEHPEYLTLIDKYSYLEMLNTLIKPDMVKPMIALNKDSLVDMISRLTPDLMSIVGAQVDTKKFAEFLLDGHLDVLKEAMMI